VTVDGEARVDPDFIPYIPEPPVQFPLKNVLTMNETHTLDVLTSAERQWIEGEINPPAVGIVRDLKNPINFTASQVDIPSEGETTTAGGRLARINDDLLVWTTYIKSEGASELRVFFSEGNFPEGVQINLFGNNDDAFTQTELRSQLDEYGLYTTSVFSDHVIIQVVIPVEAMDENLYFSIPKVIHAEEEYLNDALPLDCYQDANCSYANSYTYISEIRRATARLYFSKGGGYYLCSGGLLNDTRAGDWQPFLLTANHCFSTQASASSLQARFDYWTLSCNGSTNPSYYNMNGANLIATNSQSDFTLVLLKDNPLGSRYWLGWTSGSVPDNEVMHSTHHPSGTPMKYSRHRNEYGPSFTCTGFSLSHYHYTYTYGGQTHGGSSGGVIVKASGHVVGQLYGWCYLTGAGECDYSQFYNMWGRFSSSYGNNNLQYWLYGGGSSVHMTTSPSSTSTYPDVTIGNYDNNYIYVYNTGTVPNYLNLVTSTATITGTNANQFSIIGSSSKYLAPGENGYITVRFTPTSAGTKTATLNIPHNANNISSPKTITLTGLGIPDPCDNILPIAGCGSSYTQTASLGGTGLWFTASNTPCGYQCPGLEQVYSFTAPYTGTYSLQVTSATGYVNYMWKAAGSCSSSGWNCIARVYTTTGQYGSMSWTAGQTYYIMIDDENGIPGTYSFYVNCPIICKTCPSYDFSISASTIWQTHTSTVPYPYACKFYRVYVTAGQTYQFKTCDNGATADFDTYLELYNPGCTLIDSDDDACTGLLSYLSYDATTTGYHYLKVRGFATSNGNYTLAYRRCTKPTQPGTISGPTGVCGGTTHIYSITPVSGATSYTWTLPSGWSGSSTTNSISATAGTAGGTIYVFASNDCGSGPSRSKAVSVTNIPAQPGSISGATPVCEGSVNMYSISPVSGATSYTWSLPSGWSGSSTTTSISATTGSSSGSIWVTANNGCGASVKRYKSVSAIPDLSVPGAISGPSTVNQGSVNLYSISPVSGATSYQWTLPSGWSGSSTTTSISATAGSSGGTMYVRAVNSCFNSPWRSKSITVTPTNTSVTNVVISPSQSVCYDAVQTIWVAGGGTYFIVLNGGSATMIAGQNILYYPGTTVSAGGYMHGYIAPSGPWCGGGSLLPQVNPNRDTEEIEDQTIASRMTGGPSFKLYPNPTTGTFILELSGIDVAQPVTIMIYTMQGDRVHQEILEGTKKYELSLAGQPTGLYFVRIVTDGIAETVKVIKL